MNITREINIINDISDIRVHLSVFSSVRFGSTWSRSLFSAISYKVQLINAEAEKLFA